MFNKLYNATEDAIKATKKPFVAGKVKRGYDSAISSLEEKKIDLVEERDNLRSKIANGEAKLIKECAEKALDIKDIDDLIASLKEEKELMFADED